MLDMLEKEINKLDIYSGTHINNLWFINAIADSIPSTTIPYRMKQAIAISEIITYTSQFRKNIQHWNGSSIPINSIMFIIAKSGAAKDSSLRAARQCFNASYDTLYNIRVDIAVDRAITQATNDGVKDPEEFSSYKKYLVPPDPLFVAISTPEGFIQHINMLDDDKLGSGYIYSGEIGSDLCSNANLPEIVKLIAELYDTGTKEVKVLKAKENQSREIKEFPCSALFMGSQDNILFDTTIKSKFKTEFTTKLARRSFFIFVHEEMEPIQYNSPIEMIQAEQKIEDNCIETRNRVATYVNELTPVLCDNPGTIPCTPKVRELFTLYKKYNELLSETIDNMYPITKLTRAHMQWKAFKLSGALALMDQCSEIYEEHYLAAMEFVENIYSDILTFERELVKEPYELFATYARKYATNHKYEMSLHNLRKAGFIPMNGIVSTQLKQLVTLVSSYDTKGVYTLDKDTIKFEELVETDKIKITYVPCSGPKQARFARCNTGFTTEENTFENLKYVLQEDLAYSPFEFANGIRGKDNILGGTKWIVLDVDSSFCSDEEAHILLSDINHFIARTSNPDNEFKFRILIELNAEVDIPDLQWKLFIKAITDDLGITADLLPKSQIFFSYSGRQVLEQLEASPLDVKPYLESLATKATKPEPLPSKKTCNAMLDDPLETFNRAFNAPDNEGHKLLYWAMKRAKELGGDLEYCINLLHEINNYWVSPMPDRDIQMFEKQVTRWFSLES